MPSEKELSQLVLADTATKLSGAASHRVVVSGSHGGRYPGYLAALAKVRAIILCDAGIGKDEAGVAALADLNRLGIAAATASHLSCRIGLASDMIRRGVISRTNELARALRVHVGDTCRESAIQLCAAPFNSCEPEPFGETRSDFRLGRRRVVLIDSAAMILSSDRDAIVITGSHGGLIGGDPAAALRADAFVVAFNDAGVGVEEAGVARLAPLDVRGIAAFTVASASARIGEANSTYAEGVVSRVNQTARRLGVREGDTAASTVERLAEL